MTKKATPKTGAAKPKAAPAPAKAAEAKTTTAAEADEAKAAPAPAPAKAAEAKTTTAETSADERAEAMLAETLKKFEKKSLVFVRITGDGDNIVKASGDINMSFEHFMSSRNPVVLACSDGTLLLAEYNAKGKWVFSLMKQGSAFVSIDRANGFVEFSKVDWILATNLGSCKISQK